MDFDEYTYIHTLYSTVQFGSGFRLHDKNRFFELSDIIELSDINVRYNSLCQLSYQTLQLSYWTLHHSKTETVNIHLVNVQIISEITVS